jgi:hypothetical protein
MLTFNDVARTDDVCWRFIDADAPDHRPNVNDVNTPAKPDTWDWWDPRDFDKSYLKEHGHRRVELLEHYSERQTPTLLKNQAFDAKYVTVRTDEVRTGQGYLGIWSKADIATDICRGLNHRMNPPENYRAGHGPIQDSGFAIVLVNTMGKCVPVLRNDNDETLDELLAERVEGMRGDVALCNYEMAQRTESLCRVEGGFVSTHGDYPLSVAQASFAREIWELKLRQKLVEATLEAADKERHRVVCDDVDEMPNMEHVHG